MLLGQDESNKAMEKDDINITLISEPWWQIHVTWFIIDWELLPYFEMKKPQCKKSEKFV